MAFVKDSRLSPGKRLINANPSEWIAPKALVCLCELTS